MSHWAANVIFVVKPPRSEGDGAFGDDFGDEDYASASFTAHGAADVKSQIDFFEFRVEGNWKGSKEFCAPEAEADEAYVGFAGEGIEFGARRDVFLQDTWIDFVVEHDEVAPLSGEKDFVGARHQCSLCDDHFAEEFFEDFGGDGGGEAGGVVHRIEFDEVSADDRAGERVKVADGFARGEAAGFPVGDARGEGGIERVHVERDVDGAGEVEMRRIGKIFYFENSHGIFFGLFVLVVVQRADTDLDEAMDELLFHDSSEGAGVGVRVAFVIGVKIGVRVEMDEGDGGNAPADGAEDWSGDGMIAAEADGAFSGFDDFCDCVFDASEGVGRFHGGQVTGVFEDSGGAEVDAGFGGFVPGVGVKGLPDQRRGGGGTTGGRGVGVKGKGGG